MNNVELYNKSNIQQKCGALQYLKEYNNIINWKKDSLIIDIGCGDGSVTLNVIKKNVPNCKTIVGCDKNEDMIQFAKENYSSESVEYMVLDIQGKMPQVFRKRFHHAFSFFVFHWVQQQEKAFQNVYDILQEDGDFLTTFVLQAVFYDALRELAKMEKWQTSLKDIEQFISPYHDSPDPENKLREILYKIGFSSVEIQYKPLHFEYESEELFKGAIKSLIPVKIPEHMFDDFLNELFQIMQRVDNAVYKHKKSANEWVHNFSTFVIYIKK